MGRGLDSPVGIRRPFEGRRFGVLGEWQSQHFSSAKRCHFPENAPARFFIRILEQISPDEARRGRRWGAMGAVDLG